MKNYAAYIVVIIVAAMLAGYGCGRGKNKGAETSPADSVEAVRRMSIVFGGDVMQHLPQVQAAKRDSTYDYTETFRYIRPFIDSADIVVFNFETTVSANGRYSGYPMFSSPPQLMSALAANGVDVVALANNHTADRGYKGVKATVDAAIEYGLKYTGAFADSTGYAENSPLILESGGIKMALLNYT